MKKILLLLSLSLSLFAQVELKEYGFELKNGHYKLIENAKRNCLADKICSVYKISAQGINSYKKGENFYKNTLWFFPDTNFFVGSFALENFNKDLNISSKEALITKLLKDKKEFLKRDKLNPYGKDFDRALDLSFVNDKNLFFYEVLNYSFSSAAHPSFEKKGFVLDLNSMQIKNLKLEDIVEDSKAFRNFITARLNAHFAKHKNYIQKDYFNEQNFNILKQNIALKQDSLYISIRALLAEVDRSLDDFELSYKDLKAFMKIHFLQ